MRMLMGKGKTQSQSGLWAAAAFHYGWDGLQTWKQLWQEGAGRRNILELRTLQENRQRA